MEEIWTRAHSGRSINHSSIVKASPLLSGSAGPGLGPAVRVPGQRGAQRDLLLATQSSWCVCVCVCVGIYYRSLLRCVLKALFAPPCVSNHRSVSVIGTFPDFFLKNVGNILGFKISSSKYPNLFCLHLPLPKIFAGTPNLWDCIPQVWCQAEGQARNQQPLKILTHGAALNATGTTSQLLRSVWNVALACPGLGFMSDGIGKWWSGL